MSRHRPRQHFRLPGLADGMAIGLMGGSFDPPHSGHVHVIETARKALGLDRVWVFVAAGNPLKKTRTAFVDRFSSARRRLGGRRTAISALEAELGLIYTIDLLKRLKRRAPRTRFVWIMGGDNLSQFHRWRRWKEIVRLVPIGVISRPGASPRAGLSRFAQTFPGARIPEDAARTLKDRRAPAWVWISAPLDSTSSSELRARMMATPLPPA